MALDLAPRFTASASLSGQGGGALELSAIPSEGVQALLAPFFTGATGPAGGAGHTLTAGQNLGGHRVVISDAAGAVLADPNNANHAGRVAGITSAAVVGGVAVSVIVAGPMSDPGWSFTPGYDLWIGAGGTLTHTLPATAGAAFSQRVGYAVSPTSIWVELAEPVIF